jgi:septal ring factor EnvC (AmiA/AmiB activator)
MINLNSTLEIPAPGRDGDFDRFIIFLGFLNNVEACKARLSQINDANQEAREVINSADKIRTEIQGQRDALKAEQRAHVKKMAADRAEFEQECSSRDQQINARAKETEKLYGEAAAARDEALRITSDLNDRLQRVKAAAA